MAIVDFLANNAIWCIIGAIFFVMAIVGYLAENSEFGKSILKPKKTKIEKTKTKKAKNKPEEPVTFEEAKQKLKESGVTSIYDNEQNPGDTILSSDNLNENINAPLGETAIEEPLNLGTENIFTENAELNNNGINPISDDAWSNNVNTDTEIPTEVSANNPNEWLDAPLETTTPDSSLEEESRETDNDQLNEVPVDNLETNNSTDALFDMPDIPTYNSEPMAENSNYSDIEILHIDGDGFNNVEILNTDEKNPVEDVLANVSEENTQASEENGDNIWK